jgi:anthranilate/para-aminobenzoate synthase component I
LCLAEGELARLHPVSIAGLPRFHGGMVGYLSYEVARYFESLPCPGPDPQRLPESIFMSRLSPMPIWTGMWTRRIRRQPARLTTW